MARLSIGFLGVGTLTTALVEGMRRHGIDDPIHLSPRSEAASLRLAETYTGVIRHRSNAAVVEASDVVVLATRPPQLDGAVRGLPFRAGQIVVTAIAGTPVADVAMLVAPAEACRVLPLPTAARGEGPLVVFKMPPPAFALFEPLGDIIEASDEAEFAAYAAVSAAMSTYFTLQLALIDWLRDNGASEEGAATYCRSLLRALAGTSLATDLSELGQLPMRHETPGGLNERVRSRLQRERWFDAPGQAFDGLAALKRADLHSENG
jgi:pyrroline-5-carboxylate reductase